MYFCNLIIVFLFEELCCLTTYPKE
jgi:hypothetical protein